MDTLSVVIAAVSIPGTFYYWIKLWKYSHKLTTPIKTRWENLVSRSPESRYAYNVKKIKQFEGRLRELTPFGHEQEMESLSKIFSRLSLAASSVLYLAAVVLVVALILSFVFVITLEKEILKRPLQPLVFPAVGVYTFLMLFTGFFLVIVASLSDVSAEARKLSPKLRTKWIKSLQGKHEKLQKDADTFLKSRVG